MTLFTGFPWRHHEPGQRRMTFVIRVYWHQWRHTLLLMLTCCRNHPTPCTLTAVSLASQLPLLHGICDCHIKTHDVVLWPDDRRSDTVAVFHCNFTIKQMCWSAWCNFSYLCASNHVMMKFNALATKRCQWGSFLHFYITYCNIKSVRVFWLFWLLVILLLFTDPPLHQHKAMKSVSWWQRCRQLVDAYCCCWWWCCRPFTIDHWLIILTVTFYVFFVIRPIAIAYSII